MIPGLRRERASAGVFGSYSVAKALLQTFARSVHGTDAPFPIRIVPRKAFCIDPGRSLASSSTNPELDNGVTRRDVG